MQHVYTILVISVKSMQYYWKLKVIFFLKGLRGEFSEAHYHGVTICTYEARPNVSDHKNETFDTVNRSIQ